MSRSSTPSSAAGVSSSAAGLVQITAAGLLWGTTGVAAQLVHQSTGLSPVAIGFYRLAIAAAALVVLNARRLRVVLAAARSAPLALVAAGIGFGAYQALYFVAVAAGGIAVATVVSIGLAPILIAGWQAARSGRMPAAGTLASLAAAIAGLALITGLDSSATATAPRPVLGVLAAAGSGLGYAATTVLCRHLSRRVEPLTLTTASTAIGALALLPAALLGGGIGLPMRPLPLGTLGYLGVVTTAVAYALFYAGLRTTDGAAAVILTLLEPLAAAILAMLVLGEPLSAPVVLGGLLLLSAVLTTHVSARRVHQRSRADLPEPERGDRLPADTPTRR